MSLLVALYLIAALLLAIYALNNLIFMVVFIWFNWLKPRRRAPVGRAPAPPPPGQWPTVVIQLPIYNERFVVERLIDSVAAIDYPAERLQIQVLDDSTDDTVALARARVAHHRARGVNIDYLHRPQRTGHKAGALAYGLSRTAAEFIAVFDADFTPPADFLRRVMPLFSDAKVGLVQARWGHLNPDYSLLTYAQSFLIDAHFAIEQLGRSRLGLLMSFNGSGGVWRRACIEGAGGWEADTLTEDLDISYRAQLRGWRLEYLPDLVVPAELPTLLGGFKRQQFRWAKGSIQCLLKNGGRLLNSAEPLIRKAQGLFHLSGYLIHPLMLIVILLSLPLALTGELTRAHLGAMGLIGFGAPLVFSLSQIGLYPGRWRKRLLFLPTILLLGPGLAPSNTLAVIEALIGRNPTLFLRTPKFRVESRAKFKGQPPAYSLPVDWTTWADFFFMFYTALTTTYALQHAPILALFTASYACSFGYSAYLGLRQSLGVKAESTEPLPTP